MPFTKERQFVEAIKSGLSDKKILLDLKLPSSTFYLWKEKWTCFGDDWYLPFAPLPSGIPLGDEGVLTRSGIEHLVRQNPSRGCESIANMLGDLGRSTSATTVQKYLVVLGLGTAAQRIAKNSELPVTHDISDDVLIEVEKELAARERRRATRKLIKKRPALPKIGSRQGEVLVQDRCRAGAKLDMLFYAADLVIDTFDGRTFCCLASSNSPESAAMALDEAAAYFKHQKAPVREVLTNLGVNYGKGSADHPYQRTLIHREIALRGYTAYGERPKRLELIAGAWRAICEEFFIPNRTRFISGAITLNDIESELADWLKHTFGENSGILTTQCQSSKAA